MNDLLKSQSYLKLRPYRAAYFMGNEEEKFLIKSVSENFETHFDSYWHQFGYEIGGPVCYAFTKWLLEAIERENDITDIAFIARDGYLLKKIYEQLPHKRAVNAHYIYAPRIVKESCFKDSQKHMQYKTYLQHTHRWGKGAVATVDTITTLFSGQKLIESSIAQPVIGYCWGIIGADRKLQKGLKVHTFQPERYHTIQNWNLMEFIMTSPEPPIRSIENESPVYYLGNSFEKERAAIFEEIEKGVKEFVGHILNSSGPLPTFSNQLITKWVNDFLEHPTEEDRAAFRSVMFSITADHSDCIPLNPFVPLQATSFSTIKDKIWWWSQRHPFVYSILHSANQCFRRLRGQK